MRARAGSTLRLHQGPLGTYPNVPLLYLTILLSRSRPPVRRISGSVRDALAMLDIRASPPGSAKRGTRTLNRSQPTRGGESTGFGVLPRQEPDGAGGGGDDDAGAEGGIG